MNIDDAFAEVDDSGARERLVGLVSELRNGKPARVIDVVLRSFSPPISAAIRAKVFQLAGVADPSSSSSSSLDGDDADGDFDTQSEAADESQAVVTIPAGGAAKKKKEKRKRKKAKPAINEYGATDRNSPAQPQVDRVTSLAVMDGSDAVRAQDHGLLLTIIFVLGALSAADLFIIFPSLSSYIFFDAFVGHEYNYLLYGFVAAGYNLGQIFASPLLGLWADSRSLKALLFFCSCLTFTGNILYILSGSHVELLPIGRFFAGVGAANILSAFAHLTRISRSDEQRDWRLKWYHLLIHVSYLIGAGVGAAGTLIEGDMEAGQVTLNEFTFPAIVMCCAFGLMILAQIVHLWTSRREPRQVLFTQRIRDSDVESGRVTFMSNPLKNRDAALLFVVYFIIICTFWTFITAIIPFIQMPFIGLNYSLTATYGYVAFLIGVLTITYGTLQWVNMRTVKTKLVSVSLTILTMGSCLLLQLYDDDLLEWQLYASGALIAMAYSIAVVIIPQIFTDLTGMQFEDVGWKVGFRFAGISLAAGIGPVLGSVVWRYGNMRDLGLAAAIAGLLALALIVIVPREKNVMSEWEEDRRSKRNRHELREHLLDSRGW